ncbi:type III secretion protein Q [Duganella sp. 1411]|uniref:type III secretion system cytoplasmic ring protein SctQ n=1 Tax=Duganella sp. 1411 TaxID=2806572 RepID=UPI001AE8924F|nr:type III secretion system cytoplasmic ring protein SctQ [Duganella sp. 1411]MBP1204806.1 type III secretion protein Q [Duganella sp. 1411]
MPRDSKSIQPLRARLASLAAPLARLTRCLFERRGAALAARLGIVLAPLPAPPGVGALTHPASLQLHSAHGDLSCVIDLAGHPALECAALAPSGRWRATLADALLRPWLEDLHALGLPAMSVTALLPLIDSGDAMDHALASGLALRLRIDDDDGGVDTTLVVTDIDAALVAALEAAPRPPVPLPDWLAGLPLAGGAVLAARRCRTQVLSSLREGDVLLGWRADVSGGLHELPGVTLRWGAPQGLHYRAVADITGSVVTLAATPTLFLESSIMDHTTTADAPTDIGALELPVTLEIVTLAMPLQQIGMMQPGQVLELPLSLADARVRMVACGQTLGHGTLVVIGEQLGFQISAMVNADEPGA